MRALRLGSRESGWSSGRGQGAPPGAPRWSRGLHGWPRLIMFGNINLAIARAGLGSATAARHAVARAEDSSASRRRGARSPCTGPGIITWRHVA